MERYKTSSPQRTPQQPANQQPPQQHQETFGEMAAATAQGPGVVGRLLVLSLIIVSVAVTAFVGFAIARGVDGEMGRVNKDQFQAVFLTSTNPEVYFGRIVDIDSNTITMESVFFPRVTQSLQNPPNNAEQNVSLVDLKSAIHGPDDQMYIDKDQVVFWQNMNNDGLVARSIINFLNSPEEPAADASSTDEAADAQNSETPANEEDSEDAPTQ